jgi:tetratricopeptide (TPR) repeat protein
MQATDDPERTSDLDGGGVRSEGPARVGRYLILDRLGAGGMGVVYSAYDPQLDRRIAIKLLRLDDGAARGRGQAVLLREAQIMAQLSHPNVIAVFDVGTAGEDVFFAMERISGGTLRQWLKQRRSWREVVATFTQAGRGLAAAHAAGLVHRDFKPENVLMGSDGRPRVTDFGVALALEVGASELPATGEPGATPVLTRFGRVVGTPGYLAPEQLDGRVSAQSDQFSFCVTLFEALSGRRPFEHTSFEGYAEQLRAGRPAFPAAADAPRFVREAVLRGLDKEPARRFPSMEALLDALGRDPRRRRLRLGAAALALAGLAVVAGRAVTLRAAEQRRCSRLAATAQQSLDRRLPQIQRAFGGSDRPFAPDALRSVSATLGAFARSWGQARGAVCRGQAAVPPDLRAASAACLDQGARIMDQTAGLLGRADAVIVQNAAQMAGSLPPVADCLDVAGLRSAPSPPGDPTRAAAVAELRARLALAQILGIPRPDEGIAAVRPLVAELGRLGHAPAQAEALFVLGELQQKLDPRAGAEVPLEQAARLALQGRDDRLFVRAAGRLALVLGAFLEQPARAKDWLALARAGYERAGRPPALALWLDLQQLGLLVNAPAAAECQAISERALTVARAIGDSYQEAEASFLSLIACVEKSRPIAEVVAAAERSHALYLRSFGPQHPETAMALGGVAHNSWLAGDAARAVPLLEESLRVLRPLQESTAIASGLCWLGRALADSGRPQEALDRHREALAILRAERLPLSAAVDVLAGLADAERLMGLGDEARAHAREAVRICESRADLKDGYECGLAHFANARLLAAQGRRAAAAGEAARAQAPFAAAPSLERLRREVERLTAELGPGPRRGP